MQPVCPSLKVGWVGLVNPTKLSQSEYPASKLVTKPLCDLIFEQYPTYSFEIAEEQHAAKAEIHKTKRQQSSHEASHLKSILPDSLQHAVELAQEKGASSWLTALPVEEFGFALHKGTFRDALALWYGWSPYRAPIHCDCGDPFSMNHALSCPKGGFPSIRHNEIRDLTATFYLKSATASQPNHTCSQSVEKPSEGHQPMSRTVPDWTS